MSDSSPLHPASTLPETQRHHIDARRLLCPMPVIKAQDLIKTLQPGDVLTLVATDPGTLQDIPSWTRVHGHNLELATQTNDEYHFRIIVR
ncbi:MAG: sulfurtransferase TusA family protein [Gammaproteobacteria bacterium]|nr:sulfurtransferase TusA family protein [Gammaproteobacteria bacterium]